MGFFDSLKLDVLKDKATDLAQAGVAQSKRLAEIAKLKTANLGEEDTIKKAYLEIGKRYYEENGAVPGEAYAAACERVTAAKAAIEANNERIAELKEKEESGEPEIEVEVVIEADAVVTDAPAEEVSASDFADETPAEEAPAAEEAPKTEE